MGQRLMEVVQAGLVGPPVDRHGAQLGRVLEGGDRQPAERAEHQHQDSDEEHVDGTAPAEDHHTPPFFRDLGFADSGSTE